jgi:regulator of protease activity HflC (stomatin/prohibitin superfamily)
MKIIKTISALIILIIGGGWLLIHLTMIRIPVGSTGVRIQQYSVLGQKGVVKKDFGPGWHRDLGPIDQWELFDSTVQTLEMTRDPRKGSLRGRDDVQVQSADGYAISVDVTVMYRIMDNMAYKLYQDTGTGIKYKTIVRNEAQKACMGLFGQMKTEDFYNPNQRREKATQVKDLLTHSLSNNYVQVIDVLIRNVQFDPEYENKIRRKKLADQEVELNKSMARAEEMRGKTQVIEAETKKLVNIITKEKEAELIRMQADADLEIAKIRAGAEKYATQRRADADLIAEQKRAQGTLKIRKAEAEGERLRNQAMAGSGGKTLVALRAAQHLQLSDIMISTLGTDLLDVDAMITRLGAAEPEE